MGWQNYGNEIGEWVLCRLSVRKRSGLEYGSTSTPNSRLMFDFMMVNNKTCSSTSSSCSSSSNNIEVSSNVQDHEQDYADHF